MRFGRLTQNSKVRKLCSAVLTLVMGVGLVAGYVPYTSNEVTEVSAATNSSYPYRSVMYYGDWSIYAGQKNFTLDKIDGSLITHLNFAFLDADANGDLMTTDTWADYQNPNVGYSVGSDNKYAGVLGAMILLRQKYPNMKIGISVGGWTRSGDFPKIASSATTRNNFATNVAKFVHYYGYDFVDIDWEYPTADRDPDPDGNGVAIDKGCKGSPADTVNFTLLMQAIRDKLDEYGAKDGKYYELSCAMSASPTFMDKIEYDKVLNIVDFANMMTYDLNGAWEPFTAHQTALYTNPAYDGGDAALSVDSCIKFLENKYPGKIDFSKVVVGVAPYTRGWKQVQGSTGRDSKNPGLYADATGENGVTYAYSDIGTLKSQYNLTEYWDDTAKASYFYSASSGMFFTCDTERSVAEKGKYVKDKHLGGLISWMASLDAANSITKTMKESLYGSGAIPAQEIKAPAIDNIKLDVSASGDVYTFTLRNNNPKVTEPGGAKDVSVMPWAQKFGTTLSLPGIAIELNDGTTLTANGGDYAAGGRVTTSGSVTKVLTYLYDDQKLEPGASKTFSLKTSGTASVSNVKKVTLTQRVKDGDAEMSPTVIYGSGAPSVDPTTTTTSNKQDPTITTTSTKKENPTSTTTTQKPSTGDYPLWSDAGVNYKVGDLVQYDGKVYEVIVQHQSNWGWPPNGGGASLFKERPDLVAENPGNPGDPTDDDRFKPHNTFLPQHMVTGYWHNFSNGSKDLKLSEVPSYYDMICVAFTGNTSTPGEVTFSVSDDLVKSIGYSNAQLKADIKALQAKGQHVIISVGGAEGRIEINSNEAADRFATTLTAIIREYGFEGVDVDLEGQAVAGTTYIARGLRKVRENIGGNFIITMAPETHYMHNTNDMTGAYFRLATEIKDILTICYPQFYNAGGDNGYNGFYATYPSQQFITSLATMYIENGLRPDQLAIGVPSTAKAASNGYLDPASVQACVNSLVYKQTLGGFTPPYEYKTLRGVMTWSINWDATNNYAWAKSMKSFMSTLPIVEGEGEEPTTEVEQPGVDETYLLNGVRVCDKVEINGFQISTGVQGFRTVYTTGSEINSLDVVEKGMVYSLADATAESKLVIGESGVYSYAATSIGNLGTSFSKNLPNNDSFAMTVKFVAKSKLEFSDMWRVRAYAKLADGSYVYSKPAAFTIYQIADNLYTNNKMSNYSSHNYLYTDILKVVNPQYQEVDYDWNNSIVK